MCYEYHLSFIVFLDPYIIVSLFKIKFCEHLFFKLYLGYLQLEIKGTHSLLSTDLYSNSFALFSSFYSSLLQNGLVRFVAVLIAKYISFAVDPL